MSNLLAISAAPGEPFILVMGSGLWPVEHVERHFRDLERELRAMRVRAGFARVLVDLAEAQVQTTEAAAMLNHWTGRIYRMRDEVAVVCTSTLLAMQLRRETKAYHRAIFPDRKAALAWLVSDKEAPVAAKAHVRSA